MAQGRGSDLRACRDIYKDVTDWVFLEHERSSLVKGSLYIASTSRYSQINKPCTVLYVGIEAPPFHVLAKQYLEINPNYSRVNLRVFHYQRHLH